MKTPTMRLKTATFYLLFFTAVLCIVVPNALWIASEITHYRLEKEELARTTRVNQQQLIKAKVDDLLHYIDYVRQKNKNMSEAAMQEKILNYASTIRFGHGGYAFINQYDGQALIFEGKRIHEEKNLRDLTDANGLRLFDLELELAAKEQGGFMEYYFRKMDGTNPLPKLSYIKGLDDWQWIIGAGDYLDTMKKELEQINRNMVKNLNAKVARVIFLLMLFTVLLIILSSKVSNRLNRQFRHFHEFFQSSALENKKLNLDHFRLRELKEIGVVANQMVAKRQEMQNKMFAIQEALKAQTMLLTSVLESAPVTGIMTTDFDFEINYANATFEELFGIDSEALVGYSLASLGLNKRLTKTFLSTVAEHLETSKTFHTLLQDTHNDEPRYIDMTITGIANMDGDMTGYLFFCRDITEKKLAEDELAAYRRHLEQLVEKRTLELERLNAELLERNKELEHFNDLFVGREFRIKELKEKVKQLEKKLAHKIGQTE